MNRPDVITVGPFPYHIIYDGGATAKRSVVALADLVGQCDLNALTIWIDPDRPEARIRETLVHELLHALWDVAGLPSRDTERVGQEETVDALASGLTLLLRDNPALVKYLTAAA